MQLRAMEPYDLEAVARLCGEGGLGEGAEGEARATERFAMCREAHPGEAYVVVKGSSLVGAGFCRLWGRTGWVGPMAVEPTHQGEGVGTMLLERLVDELKRGGATVIGAEISPAASHGIGFLAHRGFKPLYATLLLERTLAAGEPPGFEDEAAEPVFYSSILPDERGRFLDDARGLSTAMDADLDYSPEVELVERFGVGESILLRRRDEPVALAVCLTRPEACGVPTGRLQVQLLALDEMDPFPPLDGMLASIELLAREARLEHVAIPVPGRWWNGLQALLQRGYRVRQADVRLNLLGFPERGTTGKINFARWR